MTINTLVQGFAANIRQLKAPQYKESQVRLHYIDRFWKLLGWDVSNDEQLPPQDVDVVVEPSMDSAEDEGLRSREPDYLFRVNSFPRFIVEAKKPAVDVDTDKRAIFQAKRYAWSATIPFAVLTDFEQFRLYDATLKPVLNDPQRGLIREFVIDFQDYPAKWDEFVATFGRDAVAEGSLEKLRARIRRLSPNRRVRTVDRMLFELRGDEPIDKVFLGYLETHRKHLARAIYHDNRREFPEADTLHGAARLTEAVQRLIDRLVFLRVCEDRGIREYGSLKQLLDRISAEGGELYPAICAEFRFLDHEYNGYLYKYHFSESLTVSGDILADFIRTLYPPEGAWNFAAIADDILGIVYERFLGSVVTVKHGEALVDQKPEVRHANGVYYTPRFVVDTIIRRVVGPKIAGRSPKEVLDFRILDPACGSGSFLVAAFQYLINHCLAAIAKDPSLAAVPLTPRARTKRKAIAFQDKKGQWQLAPDFKAALLTRCIHGVDIDQQAVEVTVMSLYLKMLEGKLPPNWQREWLENQLLPPLDNNILCGNSLIDSADFDRWVIATQGGLFAPDDDIRFRMNRFDWESRTRGFGAILDCQAEQETRRRGFDCIIGNPPYIRVQELNQWAPDECEFYRWRYKSAARGNYDIYVVFVERCLELLAPDGLLGYIMPHKFWQARYGEGLRKIIADGKHLHRILDFGDQQVFRGATTYTAIHVIGKAANQNGVDYAKVVVLEDGTSQCASIDAGKVPDGVHQYTAVAPTDSVPWSFQTDTTDKWCRKVAEETSTLGEIADVFVGVQTSADDVYHLDTISESKGLVRVRSRSDGREHDLEKAILRPLVSGQDTRAFCFRGPRQVILFLYQWTTAGPSTLLDASWLKLHAPNSWQYLKSCERLLRSRESGRFDTTQWYQFGRSQNISRQRGIKLCVPRLAERLRCAFDEDGELCLDNVDVNGIRLRGSLLSTSPLADYQFLCGILNSSLAESYIRKTVSTHFRGGFASYNRQFIESLPIKIPKNSDDKSVAEQIAESARAIMDAKTKLRDGRLSDRERGAMEREVEGIEHRIDELVFQLYGVDGLPE